MSNTIKNHQALPFLIAVYITALILRPILAVKIFTIYGLTVPAGILVFPLSFICNDIFTEIYGYHLSKNIIRAGLIAQTLSCLVIVIAVAIPGAEFWDKQNAYEIILGQNFRLAFASLLACYFGEVVNSIVLSKLKYRSFGKYNNSSSLSSRFVLSTFFGEMVDSLIYITLGFSGTLSPEIIFSLIFSTWFLKCSYELLFLPVSIRLSKVIKFYEQVDVIDVPSRTRYSLI